MGSLAAAGRSLGWSSRRRGALHRVLDRVALAARGLPRRHARARGARRHRLLGIPEANLTVHDFEVRTFPAVRQDILEILVAVNSELKPDLVLMPSLGDIHQDHETIAREGTRAFKRTTLLGYEIPWNCFSFQQQAYVSLEARHVDAKVAALQCYRVAAAPKLRQRGVHPKHRPHPRHRERPGARGGVRGVPVGDVKILVTATGAPGAASLLRGLRENGEQQVTLVGTDMRHQSAGRFLCDHFHEVPAGQSIPELRRGAGGDRPARAGRLRVPAIVGRDPRDLARRRPVRRAGAGVQARLDRAGGIEDRDCAAGRGAGDPPPAQHRGRGNGRVQGRCPRARLSRRSTSA